MSSLSKLLIASCVFLTATPNFAQEIKIGFVSTERISRDSAPAKAAEAKLESEFKQRRNDLHDFSVKIKAMAEKLDKDTPVIVESERIKRQRELVDLDQDFQRKQRAYSEDLSQRTREEVAKINQLATKAIKQIAESEKLDLILQDAIYISPRIDITDKVMKALAK